MSANLAHDKMVAQETGISTAISGIIPTALIWLVGMTPPTALSGADGLVSAALKGVGIPAFMITFFVTLMIRSRVRNGKAARDVPAPSDGVARLLPTNLIARAVIVATIATVVIVPPAVAIISALHLLPMTSLGFAGLNFALGAAVGLAVTPTVVRRALADE